MVSVIVPNWNGKGLLKGCLGSIENQTYKEHETIVADDGSTDGSADYVQREFPYVRLVQLHRNQGFAAATNAGIRIARGEFLAFLNNDAEAHPKWLAEMVHAIRSDATIGFVGPKILDGREPTKIAAAGGRFSRNGSATDFGRGELDSKAFDRSRPVLWVTGAACMFRRQVFDVVGLLDESFGSMSEDVDICLRAQLKGFRGLYVPFAIVYHAVSTTWEKDARRRLYLSSRNENYVITKDLPRRVLAECLPWIVAHQAFMALRSVLVRDIWSYLRGKLAFFMNFSRVWKARQEIQAGRTVPDAYIRSFIE
jgi:GT2 family glycosyltransferase